MSRSHTVSRRKLALGAALAATVCSLHAFAQADSKPSLERFDRKFIENTAQGSLAEVELGRLGFQRASDVQVKSFADTVVREHGKAGDELASIARAKGVELPTKPERSHKRDVERLGKLSGTEFDRAFMKQMASDHRRAVNQFERAARAAKDPELRTFATRTLPTLQEHMKLAQSVEAAIATRQ